MDEAAPTFVQIFDGSVRNLLIGFHELDLKVRTQNCLESWARGNKLRCDISSLCTITESDVLGIHNFGKSSLRDLNDRLGSLGLRLPTAAEAAEVIKRFKQLTKDSSRGLR